MDANTAAIQSGRGEEQMRLIDADELQMAHGLKNYDDTEQIKVTTFDQIARWIDEAPTVAPQWTKVGR